MEEARKVNESVHPSDSVSVAASRKCKASSARSSASSASSARLKAEMERAALVAQAAGLRQKHALEEQEAEIKVEKEALESLTMISAATMERFGTFHTTECTIPENTNCEWCSIVALHIRESH